MPIGPDFEKLFHAGRLNPNLPEHKKLIDGYTAMYAIHAPEKAKEISELYAKLYKKPEKVEVVEEKPVTPEVETPKEEKPKRGRKPSILISHE